MKRACFVCLFSLLITTFLLSQSNPVPATNPTASVASPASASPKPDKPKAQMYLPPCPSTTKVFDYYGNTNVTQPVTIDSESNMDIYCHDVYNAICTGDVFFYDWIDGARSLLGKGSPISGNGCGRQIETTSLTVGTHVIEAVYTDDSTYDPSSGTTTVQITTWPTTTAVTSSPNPSNYGEDVTFTVTAAGGIENAPTGKVRIRDGATPLASPTLSANGVATFTIRSLAAGTHSITAEYLGDSLSAKSTSPVLDQVVNSTGAAAAIVSSPPSGAHLLPATQAADKPPQPDIPQYCWSKTFLSSSGSPSLVTDGVTITAQMILSDFCRGIFADCGGEVVFYEHQTAIGTVSVDSGCTAQISLQLPIGNHFFRADFNSETFWRPSSGTFTQEVDGFPSMTTLTSSPNPSVYGEEVGFTATVTSTLGGPAPTRKVKFTDGATTLGFVTPDSNGVATLTKRFLPVGTDSITAEYMGDSLYAPSASPSLSQVVNPEGAMRFGK
jgi:Bacterial Ig-like domain (group 3)